MPLILELDFSCPKPEDPTSRHYKLITKVYYYYALLKLYDLSETFFFVLRKKQRQVSLLHVYHHIGMVLLVTVPSRFYLTLHAIILGLTNTFVHCVMYSYYLYAASKTREVWWKKYVTVLQIVMIF